MGSASIAWATGTSWERLIAPIPPWMRAMLVRHPSAAPSKPAWPRFPMPKRSAPSCGITAAGPRAIQPLPGLRTAGFSARSACHADPMLSGS